MSEEHSRCLVVACCIALSSSEVCVSPFTKALHDAEICAILGGCGCADSVATNFSLCTLKEMEVTKGPL